MKEIWKPIKNYPDYIISNTGKIKSFKSNKLLKFSLTGTTIKYYSVYLRNKNGLKHFYIARLVLIHFLGNPPSSKHETNHIDFNPLNNNINNLEWVTSKENSQHSRLQMSFAKQGEKHPKAKFTDKQALEIKILRKKRYKIKHIAELYNTSPNNITNIVTRYYKHLNKYL
jgi:hypothetical protein